MQVQDQIKNLPLEKRKMVLYKIVEIFSNDGDLLNFIDNLQWEEQVNFVCDILLAWKENRENLWKEVDIEMQKMLNWLQQEKVKVDLLSLEIEELMKENEEIFDAEKILDDAFDFND